MKGVILAGGTGSRLGKLTAVVNKHLIGVGDTPMIEFPISTLKKIGFDEIIVVTGAEHAGTVTQYLSNVHPEIDFTYKVQQKAGGIAQALNLTKNVCKGHNLAVILGDNIFEENFSEDFKYFEEKKQGARIFLKKVSYESAKRFGCAVIEKDKVKHVEEKPENPRTNWAMAGLYFFDSQIFDVISELKPSNRGELEITDAIKKYVEKDNCYYSFMKGFWTDAGTPESLMNAIDFVRNHSKNF